MNDLERGKQLRVPLYALEDYDSGPRGGGSRGDSSGDGPNVDIGSFGYDDDEVETEAGSPGESTDAMFDDKGEFADVAASVTELTDRGYKLARRTISMGGSVRDILDALNSLYIRPPDIRTANPTIGSYAFTNIMLLLKKDGLVETQRGMPVKVVYRPPASRQVFREANPDDPTMAGLGGLGQYAAYGNEELAAAVTGMRVQAVNEAARRRRMLKEPGKRAKLIQLATRVAVRTSSVEGGGPIQLGWEWSDLNPITAVKNVTTAAYDYATDVVLGDPLGRSARSRENLEHLEAETQKRIDDGRLSGDKAAQMTSMLKDTKEVFDEPLKVFVKETAKGITVPTIGLLVWLRKYAPWLAGGAAVLFLGPPLLRLGATVRSAKAKLRTATT